MAKDEIIIKAELQVAQSRANIKKLNQDMQNLDMRLTESKLKVKQLANEELKLAKAKQTLIKRNKELTLSQKGLSNSTGAATSAALELGRVISDAPYGIRGVANNVSQLASQFSFMASAVDKTTGKVVGFNGALKNFGKALKANAVLLVIQAVVSALDYFAGGMKKAEERIESMTGTLDNLLSKLNDLQGKLPDAISDILDRLGIKNTEFSDFAKNMQETLKVLNNEFPEFKKAYDNLSDTQKKDPKIISNIITKYRELINVRKDIVKTEALLKELNEATGEYAESNLKRNRESYKQLILRKIELESIFKTQKNQSKKYSTLKKFSPFKTKEELEIDIKDNESAIIQYEKQIEAFRLKEEMNDKLSTANTEEEKLKIKQNYQKDLLISQIKAEKDLLLLRKNTEESVVREKTKNHIADLKRIYEKYLLELKLNTKISDAEKERLKSDATSSFFNSLTQASAEEINSLNEIDTKYKELIKTLNILSDAKLSALFSGFFGNGEDGSQSEVMKLTEQIEIYKNLVSSVGDFIGGEYDRQIAMEQNKTNALNAELNDRLLNENLSKEERQRIQNQITQNDEKLRKKQEVIARKKFNTEKAFNIAVATTDTIVAGISAAKATYGGPVAKIAAMTATIGAGLAQVAVIARQKFQSSSANTPINTGAGGGGGDGVGDREFNFNLVGNTQENQLLETLQGQFSQPLQAFVVSKDITTQQELDANIQGQARI